MGFFSNKITTDKITETLIKFFETSYGSLVVGLKESFKNEAESSINEEQDKELMVVAMFAVTKAVLVAFGDTQKTKDILGKLQHDAFKTYFKEDEERKQFGELLWKRAGEYSQVLTADNKDLDIQFGQIFCTHYFGKDEDESHLAMMTFVGQSFLNTMVETKKFLDEVSSKYDIV